MPREHFGVFDMMKAPGNLRWMRPIRDCEREKLAALAHSDNHALIAPTHVFVKNGELIGYASVGSVPLILPWFDTRRCKAVDSLYFINQLENLTANAMPSNGQNLICVPVVENSPFTPHISRLGYVEAGMARIVFKEVR